MPGSIIPLAPAFAWAEGVTIGRGAFGMVTLGIVLGGGGRGPVAGAPVAVKDIPLASDEAWLISCREALALSLCAGPLVVALHGMERAAPSADSPVGPLGRARLVMEYVPGGTLSHLAKSWGMARGAGGRGGLPPLAVAAYARGLLRAVAHVHSKGVAHRDIKGSNALLAPDGTILLADFGSARLPAAVEARLIAELGPPTGGGEGSSEARLERGTLQWMAPEVLLRSGGGGLTVGSHEWWCAADVWSVGATVLELLTGAAPWARMADDSAGVQLAMACVDLRSELPPGTPPLVSSFLTLALHPTPSSRPSASGLLEHPFVRADGAGGEGWEWGPEEGPPSSPPRPPPSSPRYPLTPSRALPPGRSFISWSALLAAAAAVRSALPLARLACRGAERWVGRAGGAAPPGSWAAACACKDGSGLEGGALMAWAGAACDGAGSEEEVCEAVGGAVGRTSSSSAPHFGLESWVLTGYGADEAVEWAWGAGGAAAAALSPAGRPLLATLTGLLNGAAGSGGRHALAAPLAALLLALLAPRVAAWVPHSRSCEEHGAGGGLVPSAPPPSRSLCPVALASAWLAAARGRMAAAQRAAPLRVAQGAGGEEEEEDGMYDDVEEEGGGADGTGGGGAPLEGGREASLLVHARLHVWAAELAAALDALAALALARRSRPAARELGPGTGRLIADVERRVYARYLSMRPALRSLLTDWRDRAAAPRAAPLAVRAAAVDSSIST
jgi:serine/threonine protein kinase